jgi:ABC-type transport system substrate-binding protein
LTRENGKNINGSIDEMLSQSLTKWIGLAVVILAIGCAKKNGSSASKEMVLRLIMPTQIHTLDPGDMRDMYSRDVADQIIESLYTYHYLKRPFVVIPVLAEDLPQISPDGLTYTIRIKKGVRFQDDACFPGGKGRELKADDFVYAVKRIANVRYASQNWSNIDNRFVGLNEFREYTKKFKNELDVDYNQVVEGYKALDDYTLQIRLITPWPQLIETALTDSMTAPMPYEAVNYYGKDIIRKPVGTGSYILKVWQRGCYIELVRNPNWRGELYPSEGGPGDVENGFLADAGKPVPFADRIVFRIVEEEQPSWFLFMQGYADRFAPRKDTFGQAFGSATRTLTEAMIERGIEKRIFNDCSAFWIGFNLKDPVLGGNLPLRKAISRAIDRQRYIDLLFNGKDIIAHGFIPPGINSYDPNIIQYGYSKYDLQEARDLLKEAKTMSGGKIPLLTLDMPGTDTLERQMGALFQRQLEQAGIELRVEYMDWPTYLEKINKGQSQMFSSGVGAGSPDALDLLEMFIEKNFAPGGNVFFYSNPDYEKLYQKVKVMQDCPERTEIYRKMERMVMEDYPAVLLNHRMVYYLNHDWYQNYKPHIFNHSVLKYHRVDVQKREEYSQRLKQLKKEGQ